MCVKKLDHYKVFTEVILAMWNDFNNPTCFTKGKDVLALITGNISKTDNSVTIILEEARHCKNFDEFNTKINLANFHSNTVRTKYEAIKSQLKKANAGNDVNNDDLFSFLQHFHLLGYDLDIKNGVVSSLIKSHISQFNKDIPDVIWSKIIEEVQSFNQNAGTITLDTLSEDILDYFKEPNISYIAQSLTQPVYTQNNNQTKFDWNTHDYAQDIALANLIGAWNENSKADIAIVERITGEDYSKWIVKIRETLQSNDSPFTFKNKSWRVNERLDLWGQLSSRVFDDTLDNFKQVVFDVLSEDDPSFELDVEDRFMASIIGKVLPHSAMLRTGLAEMLAILGNNADLFINCSRGKADVITIVTIRNLFANSNWLRWGSLNYLLPTLAEASPNEFLVAVEKINETSTIFKTLFAQEHTRAFSANYMIGLLWSLETLAWEKEFLVRTAVLLSELADIDLGGNYANRPINSLTDIFLPWRPHTRATLDKRKVAIKTICDEQPKVGWNLLQSLLPNSKSITIIGTHQPKWRSNIPEDWGQEINNEEYRDFSIFCSELLVELAHSDVEKITSLIKKYDHLAVSNTAIENLQKHLLSENIINLVESKKTVVWSELTKFTQHHRRYPSFKWSLPNEYLIPLDEIVSKLEPQNPLLKYQRLFNERDMDLYQNMGTWGEKNIALAKQRKNAIKEIYESCELTNVLDFAFNTSNCYLIGQLLAEINQDISIIDKQRLLQLLDRNKYKEWEFIVGFVGVRFKTNGWSWFNGVNKENWCNEKIALLLTILPFEKSTWEKAQILLDKDVDLYWSKVTNVAGNNISADIKFITEKFIEIKRQDVAFECLYNDFDSTNILNIDLACNVLLELINSDTVANNRRMRQYEITKIIKYLQENIRGDSTKMFQIEWAYLPFLNKNSEASPVTLENTLASDPKFFCQFIEMVYLSENKVDEKETSSPMDTNMVMNAYNLLDEWKVVPSCQNNQDFNEDEFVSWFNQVKESTEQSGHYPVAMTCLGKLLLHAPEDSSGLFIHSVVADLMNKKTNTNLREGYTLAIYNSRGAHWVDPEAKAEKELAEKYNKQATDAENSGYFRLATTLKHVAKGYSRNTER